MFTRMWADAGKQAFVPFDVKGAHCAARFPLHNIPGIHRATQDSSQPPAQPELEHLPSLSKLSRLLHSPSPSPEVSFLRGLPPPACYGGSAPSLSKPHSAHRTVRVFSISASST